MNVTAKRAITIFEYPGLMSKVSVVNPVFIGIKKVTTMQIVLKIMMSVSMFSFCVFFDSDAKRKNENNEINLPKKAMLPSSRKASEYECVMLKSAIISFEISS